MAETWLKCSACKNPIPFNATHWVCSVSTCNRARTRLVFCTVVVLGQPRRRRAAPRCVGRRDARADDGGVGRASSPRARRARAPPRGPPPPQRATRGRPPSSSGDASQPTAVAGAIAASSSSPTVGRRVHLQLADVERDMLIVVSKMKKYIKDRSGMNCSDAVADVLARSRARDLRRRDPRRRTRRAQDRPRSRRPAPDPPLVGRAVRASADGGRPCDVMPRSWRWRARCSCAPRVVSYPGGMVLRFTAKVRKREVVVRGVDLPDGATVDVTIDPQEAGDDLTPEELAEIERQEKLSMAEYRRGEYFRGEDIVRWVRGGPAPVLVRDQPARTKAGGSRGGGMAPASRKRKPSVARSRKRS